MDGTAIIIILAIAGVASVLLFALKGLLDQVPDVIDSAGKARDAWHRLKKPEVPEPDRSQSGAPRNRCGAVYVTGRRESGAVAPRSTDFSTAFAIFCASIATSRKVPLMGVT